MNVRLKELRKALGLTQVEFAKRIGSVQNTITGYESGRRVPSNPVVSAICKEFHVNESWLRTGEGPMFAEPTVNEQITAWIDQILTDEPEGYKVRLVSALSRLDPDGWRALYELAAQFVGAADPSLLPGHGQDEDGRDASIEEDGDDKDEDGDDVIEREADILRESYIQTRKGEARSSESSTGNGNTCTE